MYGDLARPPLPAGPLRRALVVPGGLWTEVEVVRSSPSTNAALVKRAADPAADGVVLVAEHQTAGRGRLGRTWTAPPRAAITGSVLVRPRDIEVARWPWIPLLAGLAVAATLRREALVAATVKWPNDVLVEERKLAGVLVERVEAARGSAAAVIGIGLNVSQRAEELPVPSATSLALEGAATTDRSVLLRAVLRALEGLLTDWYTSGGDPASGLGPAYVEACGTLGRRVRLDHGDGTSTVGNAVGVDGGGRLLVRTAGRQVSFGAGDVVHLRPAP